MIFLYTLASFAFILWMIRNTFFWVNLWQIKEYRLDRLLVHFKENSKGKDLLLSPVSTIKWVLLFAFIVPALYDYLLFPYQLIVVTLLLYDAFTVVKELYTHRLRIPTMTMRAMIIIVLTFLTVGFLYFFPLVDDILWLLILSRLIPIIITIYVYLLSIPSDFVKDIIIAKASKKLQEYKNLLVIGISGSYGKSSTKDYIAQVLSHKFKVVKTIGSHNTPMGIAGTISRKMQKNTQIFVVELGSYKKGEVKELCNIVHPKISVTTSISDQHLSLYGSFENIVETEKELVDAIPKEGLTIFNGNNSNSYKLFLNTRKRKVLYTTDENKTKNIDNSTDSKTIVARNIQLKKDLVSFDVMLGSKKHTFQTALLGVHNVENILPAIYLAVYLGMSMNQIKNAVSELVALPKTMVPYLSKKGFTVIDDSFNSSPESVLAAIAYLSAYNKKKFYVLEPMIELGKNAEIDHYKLGKEFSTSCDYLYLTNSNFLKSIQQGIADGNGKCKVKVASINLIAELIQTHAKKDDVILLEGREAGVILNKLI